MVNRFGHPSLFDMCMGDEFAIFTVIKLNFNNIFSKPFKKNRIQKVRFCSQLVTDYVQILGFKNFNQKSML